MPPRKITALVGQPIEWHYVSGEKYPDPFNDIELDVLVSNSDGESWRVPAYWAGGNEWRVRFAAPKPGIYEAATECTNDADPSLHGVACEIEVRPARSGNPLYAHGPLRVDFAGTTVDDEARHGGALTRPWRPRP